MGSNSEGTYRLANGVISVPVEEESVVLSMNSEKYFGVRGAMRHLLQDLSDGISVEGMISRTCARYQVAPQVARDDLEAMLPRLVAAGILERVN